MRPSTAPNRASVAQSAAAITKLREKKKEFDAVGALENMSQILLNRIEGVADDCDIMAVAGEVHGNVLAQWPRMFQILNLFLAAREKGDEQQGDVLVRIPIEDLEDGSRTTMKP